MELIFAYIDNYRTFSKQGVSFSDKFIVEYMESSSSLNLSRNNDYFDIYPANVISISAVVGKNASGKSSLLSLIGKQIDDRHRNNEIWKKEYQNPHEKFDIFTLKKTGGLDSLINSSSYFLLYFYGKDQNGEDLFVFETNHPMKYIGMLSNTEVLTADRREFGPSIDYFSSKGWLSCVFKLNRTKNTYVDDTQNFKSENGNIQSETSILYFQNKGFESEMETIQRSAEEAKISIKRRTVSLESVYIYEQLKFLLDQLNIDEKNRFLFKNQSYSILVNFSDAYPSPPTNSDLSFSDALKDYRDFKIDEFSEQQRIVLAFLFRYTCYLFTATVFTRGEISEEKETVVQELTNMQAADDSFENVKSLYHQKIDLLLKRIDDEDLSFSAFKKSEESFEYFLADAKASYIDYTFSEEGLTLKVYKETKLDDVKRFFDDCVDAYSKNNNKKQDSVLGRFFETTIPFLSDGERENLKMFTSIHEQIALHYPDKKKYILLFDEIERSMHPEMCRCLITNLMEFLHAYHDKEFQIIIATHSPFIISDIRKENVICLSRKEENLTKAFSPDSNTLGQNIHTLLKGQFFLDSTFGAYSTKLIELIVDCIKSDDAYETIKKINEFIDVENYAHEKRSIITGRDAIDFLETTISSIGENVIRDHLCQLLSGKKHIYYTVEERIAQYEEEISKLKREVKSR